MTDPPDYANLSPPPDKAPEEYDHHERRAEIFDILVARGEPSAVSQTSLAERFDVADSTISRDMDRIRESVDDHLGREAKLTTRTLFQRVLRDLLDAEDWRATKAAWDVLADWNDWLAEVGEQEREPDRAELDVDVDATRKDISYTVVREEPALPTEGDDGSVDYEALGFTIAPTDGSAPVDVEPVENAGGEDGD